MYVIQFNHKNLFTLNFENNVGGRIKKVGNIIGAPILRIEEFMKTK